MGMDQKITFAPENLPAWPQFVDLLATRSLSIQLRMIDGELALPNETPPHDWRELRVGTPAGMVTLRRETDGITLVVWGNADDTLRRDRDALAAALRELTGAK